MKPPRKKMVTAVGKTTVRKPSVARSPDTCHRPCKAGESYAAHTRSLRAACVCVAAATVSGTVAKRALPHPGSLEAWSTSVPVAAANVVGVVSVAWEPRDHAGKLLCEL